ncbi:MAG: transcription antitermination factor NusB [Candidatus Gracilibacteria bacterium]|nr:transcription antitermination factor NusB [Candidatus Gracilibacteria bacterium]
MSNFSRSRTRKFLYQMLYASTFSKIDIESFRESFFSGVFESNLDEEYLKNMYDLIIKNESFLINLIQKYAPKFDIENMDLSYVLPIFICSTEIFLYSEEIPTKVSLNEAIEISKIYGDDSSRKTVNGVLNNILNDLEELKTKLNDFKENGNEKTLFKK